MREELNLKPWVKLSKTGLDAKPSNLTVVECNGTIHYLFGVRWIEKGLKEREAKAEYMAREIKKK